MLFYRNAFVDRKRAVPDSLDPLEHKQHDTDAWGHEPERWADTFLSTRPRPRSGIASLTQSARAASRAPRLPRARYQRQTRAAVSVPEQHDSPAPKGRITGSPQALSRPGVGCHQSQISFCRLFWFTERSAIGLARAGMTASI